MGRRRSTPSIRLSKQPLSGCAKVLDYFESWTFRLMKARPQVPQQRFGSGPQRVPVGPPAVAAQFVLHMTPDPLHQVQLRGIGGQKKGADPALPAPPPGRCPVAFVIA